MNRKTSKSKPLQGKEDRSNLSATSSSNDKSRALSDALLQLTDEFAEFACVNAFLTSSFVAVMSSDEPVRAEVIQGAKRCAEMIQSQSQAIQTAINQLRER